MNKRKLIAGTKASVPSLLDNIQADIDLNIDNRIIQLYSSYGLMMDLKNGVATDNRFLVTRDSDTEVTISAGKALTKAYEAINYPGATVNVIGSGKADGEYMVVLTYTQSESEPSTITNGFYYDSGASATSNTKFADSYTVTLVATTTDISTSLASLANNQVALAIVKVATNVLLNTNFTYDSVTASTGVIDLRSYSPMKLNTSLVPDDVVLFKDRPSTGNDAFAQNIEFSANADITGDLRVVAPSGENYIIHGSGDQAHLYSTQGLHWRVFKDAGNAKTEIKYLEADAIKLKVAGEYRDVIASGPASTVPRNLRIFDIYPTEDPNEKKGYIEVRWNWDGLNVTGTTTSTVTIDDTSYENESIVFSGSDISTYLPGKYIYFVNTSNTYEITSVVDNTGTYTITVDGDPSAESTDSSNPMRIIDHNVEVYRLKFRSSSQQGAANKEIIAIDLSTDFVTNPAYIHKLELNRQWFCSIQAENNSSLSAVVTMPAGSYDPDHSAGGQPVVNYGSPFTMELPDLDSSGTLDLTATSQGFNVNVTGWSGGDNQTRRHEYEILWSDTVTISAGTFDTLPLPNGVEQRFSRSGTEEIFSGAPKLFSVGVRPMQNRQGVGTPIIKEVASGGGGIVPESQLLFEGNFSLMSAKFQIDYPYFGGPLPAEKIYAASAYNVVTNEYEFIDPKELYEQEFVKPAQTNANPANFSTDVTFTASTGGDITITPSFVSGSTPYGQFYKFVGSSNTTPETLIENNDAAWAKIAPNAATAVASGESVGLKAVVTMHNWGRAKCNFYLIDNDTEEELAKAEHIKGSVYDYYPDGGDARNTKTMTVNWENTTASTVNVRWEIRGWGYNGDASADNASIIHVFVDGNTTTGNNYQFLDGASIGGLDYSGEKVNFGNTPIDFAFIRDGVLNNQSTSYSTKDVKITSFQGDRTKYGIQFNDDPNSATGDEFYVGVNKASRFIHREDLNVDYKITRISVRVGYVNNVTASHPGIIRVYSNGNETSAVKVEIEGVDDYRSTVDLPVKISGSDRYFIVDGFDPSALPNNRAEIRGLIIIRGQPIIKDNLS